LISGEHLDDAAGIAVGVLMEHVDGGEVDAATGGTTKWRTRCP
jgi:hypothetical protein